MVDSVRGSLLGFLNASEMAIDEMVIIIQSDDSLESDGMDYEVVGRHNLSSFFSIRANPWMSMIQLIVFTNITILYRDPPNAVAVRCKFKG